MTFVPLEDVIAAVRQGGLVDHVITRLKSIPQVIPNDITGDSFEAVRLLTKVCMQVEKYPVSHARYMLEKSTATSLDSSNIPGLPEWWAKHKPKTEREVKIEKIIKLIQDCTHSENDAPKYLAERILDAIS